MTKDVQLEKLDMEAKPYDKVLEKVMELCPAAVQNGKVDFDRLKAELSDVVDDDAKETYEFKWVGKNKALVEANKPIRKTLRPCKEESKNWDTTENLYIEGDNLEALKLLQEGYLGKIKMIYIDPPYNTGKDFVYHDYRVQSKEEMNEGIGLFDEDGNRQLSSQFIKNKESSGRFHSDWCTMMYPRLKLACDLLSDDGVIFISIDDNEVANLKKICDEVFGGSNFIAQIVVEGTPKNDPYIISTAHEYCLVYTKNFEKAKMSSYGIKNPLYDDLIKIYEQNGDDYNKTEADLKNYYSKHGLISENISNYKYADGQGVYRIGPIDDPQSSGSKDERINPNTGKPCCIPSRGWSCSVETWKEWIKQNLILFPDTDDILPSKKTYISSDRLDVMKAYFKIQTRKDTDYLKKLFNTSITPFSNPKPVELLKMFIENCNDTNFIVMDFFSGSASTAHAVMELNVDGLKRKYIMIQFPEIIEESKSSSNKEKKIAKAAKEFLKSIDKPINISEIGKERIRRAGDKIVQETGKTDLDIGFRVLKVDETNMQDVYYNPAELTQKTLLSSIDNIKTDRQPLDLLFGVMVDWGVPLTLPLQEVKVGANTIHVVGDNDLVACFDNNVTPETITKMAELNPTRAVFRDTCFAKDDAKINMFEIFKTICHWDDKKAKDNIRVM